MAAVTVNGTVIENVNGSVRESFYPITVVTTGDTLAVTGFSTVYALQCNNTSITNMAYSSGVVTFTGTGANLLFRITGH